MVVRATYIYNAVILFAYNSSMILLDRGQNMTINKSGVFFWVFDQRKKYIFILNLISEIQSNDFS